MEVKNRDALTSAQITGDGGIILGGSSYSPAFADKSEEFLGNNDFWIVKLNANGARQWDKTYRRQFVLIILPQIDTVGSNGYVLAGYSNFSSSFNKTDSCRELQTIGSIRLDNAVTLSGIRPTG
jgi:hypothetical protein